MNSKQRRKVRRLPKKEAFKKALIGESKPKTYYGSQVEIFYNGQKLTGLKGTFGTVDDSNFIPILIGKVDE